MGPGMPSCFHKESFSLQLSTRSFPLPIFGNLFELGNKPHESLAELAATYDPLMTLKLGSVTAMVVSSANMAKEVLQKHDQTFLWRTIPHVAQAINHHEVSMTWLPSSLQWRTLRKICATQIFTAQRLNDNEGTRLTKVKDLIDHIREEFKSKHTINIGQTVFSTILNMILNALFSIDLTPYQSKSRIQGNCMGSFADNYFPLLRPFDPQGIKRRMSVYFRKLDKLFDTIIDQRLQSKKQDASRDLLDILLHYTEENGFKLGPLDIRALLKAFFDQATFPVLHSFHWELQDGVKPKDIDIEEKFGLTLQKAKPLYAIPIQA
ncbi:hypothetical protein IFM89_005835 [Coptis chinensis]|uniref:Cytochrome P450 n=1 Tax=Coptis chinensis TaxID=261450 RepID=A0A835LHS5_9MAGN|nr:hypothetical protein IFM89_005835 [Coptis chinensis]